MRPFGQNTFHGTGGFRADVSTQSNDDGDARANSSRHIRADRRSDSHSDDRAV